MEVKDNDNMNDMFIFESVIILQPNLTEEENKKIIKEYYEHFSTLSEHSVDVNIIGKKKLAYNIKDNTEGYYVIYKFCATGNGIRNLENKYRVDKNVIKFVTIRKEKVYEKIEDKSTENGEILNYEEGLKQRVQDKVLKEYNELISELEKERPQVILERAYEKVCKEEMVNLFENRDLSVNECKALLKCPNILEEAYDEWLNIDANFNEQLEFAVDNSVERIVKSFMKGKKLER